MEEQEIISLLELAKYNELQNLQWKVEYLRNEVNMLESEKTKAIHSLAQRRGEMAYMNQGLFSF
jgi:cell division protein FtsB